MKDGKNPDPNTIHPIAGYENEIYVKPTVTNPNIIVGEFTYIADRDFESHVTHLYDWNGDRLIIGKFCQIASGVEFVMNGANHQMNAVILPGIHIGDGAIIGANTTVASDIPPYTVSAGNPARIIRKRFDDEFIDLLERFKWWDKPIEEINALIPILTNSNLKMVRKEINNLL